MHKYIRKGSLGLEYAEFGYIDLGRGPGIGVVDVVEMLLRQPRTR